MEMIIITSRQNCSYKKMMNTHDTKSADTGKHMAYITDLPPELFEPICDYVAHDDMISALHLAGAAKAFRTVLERKSRRVVRRTFRTKNRADFTFLRLKLATTPCPLRYHLDSHLIHPSTAKLAWNGKAKRFQCNSCLEQVHNARRMAVSDVWQDIQCSQRRPNVLCVSCDEMSMECEKCSTESMDALPVYTETPPENGETPPGDTETVPGRLIGTVLPAPRGLYRMETLFASNTPGFAESTEFTPSRQMI